ncbi:MAG: hypothetical protein E7Z67_04005 [Thermoplasmata archaeon]|nr:hypothetical protein [Thermoplasmata archaeon]
MALDTKFLEILLVASIVLVGVTIVGEASSDDEPYDMEISVIGGGSTDPGAGTYSVPKDTETTITFTADAGWFLASVTVNGEPVEQPSASMTVLVDRDVRVEVIFLQASVVCPGSVESVYSGEPVVAYRDTEAYTVTGASATDAGVYTAIFSLRYPENTHWSDGTGDDKQVSWSIVPLELEISYFQPISDVTYSDEEIRPTVLPIFPVSMDGLDVDYEDNVHAGIAKAIVTGSGNYSGTVSLTFDILPEVLDVVIDDKSTIFGSGAPVFTYSISGFVGDDTVDVLIGELTLSCDYDVGDDVGRYPIVGSGLSASDYDIRYSNGELTVIPYTIVIDDIEVDTSAVTYDGTSRTKTVTSINPLVTSDDLIVTYEDNVHAGIAKAIVSGTGNCTGALTYTFNILPKNVSVTAVPITKIYGFNDPTLLVRIQGLVGDDEIVYSVTREIGEDVGLYDILVIADELQGNYNVSCADSTFNIIKRHVKFTSGSDWKVLDNIALTDHTVSTGSYGLAEEDSVEFTYTGSQTHIGSSENTFTYEFTSGKESNYRVDVVYGTLTVVSDTIVVTAGSDSKKYDGTPLKAGYTVAGVVETGDVVVVTLDGSQTDVGSSMNKVVSVRILRSGQDVTDIYTIGTHKHGTLEVTERELTITSLSASKEYDGKALTDHHVSITGDGFVTGQGVEGYSFTGAQTSFGKSKNTFTYTLNDNTDPDNYLIETVFGELSVTRKAVHVTPSNDSKVYGDADPNLSATVTGMVTGEDPTILLRYTVLRAPGEDVGNYDISISMTSADQGNYRVISQKGTFTITKAPLVVDITDDATKVYGDDDPNYTFTVSGYKRGDSGLVRVMYDREEGEDVGKYTVRANLAKELQNYDVTFIEGYLSITRAPLEIVAEDMSKTYGDLDPVLSYIANGLKLKDTKGMVSVTLKREVGENAGTYPITAMGPSETQNYTVSYRSGTFTIDRKAIEPPYFSKVYDGMEHSYPVSDMYVIDKTKGTYQATDSGLYWVYLTPTSNYMWKNGSVGQVQKEWGISMRALTLTGTSGNSVYNGQEQSVSGYTVSGLVDGHLCSGIEHVAKGTDVGTYQGEFIGELRVMSGDKDVTKNYDLENGLIVSQLTITEKSLTSSDCRIDIRVQPTFNGSSQKVSFSVYDGTTELDGDDFNVVGTATFSMRSASIGSDSGTDVGTYTLVIEGDGNYKDSISKEWSILPYTLRVSDFEDIPVQEYDGQPKTPVVCINQILTKDDYSVEYSDNVFVGKATAKITGTRNATGTVYLYFDIYSALSVYVTNDGYGNTYGPTERDLSSFGVGGAKPLYDLRNIRPGISETAEMTVMYPVNPSSGAKLALVVTSLSGDTILAENMVLKVERGDTVLARVTVADAYTNAVMLMDMTGSSADLKVTMELPHGPNDNLLMEKNLRFTLGLSVWYEGDDTS